MDSASAGLPEAQVETLVTVSVSKALDKAGRLGQTYGLYIYPRTQASTACASRAVYIRRMMQQQVPKAASQICRSWPCVDVKA